jgi:hypothetical protein
MTRLRVLLAERSPALLIAELHTADDIASDGALFRDHYVRRLDNGDGIVAHLKGE